MKPLPNYKNDGAEQAHDDKRNKESPPITAFNVEFLDIVNCLFVSMQ